MIINSIILNNFRQYKGKQSIEFSTDKERNVTVILGINTSGKTTIVQAFNWCLYGKSNFNSKDVINIELTQSMGMYSNQDVYVEISLIHDNKEYIIRRTQKFTKKDYDRMSTEQSRLFVQYKEPNGEMQEIGNCEDEIEKILPEALAGYFFFDGERISDINTKGDVVSAVRGLMGLDVISDAVDHFNPNRQSSVVSKLKKEIDIGQDQRSSKLKYDLAVMQTNREGYEKRLVVVKNEETAFEDRKQVLGDLISGNKETKAYQTLKRGLELDIERMTNEIEPKKARLVKDFSKGAYKYFATPLIAKALAVIASAKQDGVGIPYMHSNAIDYILKRGKCLCGCDLTKNQGAVDAIMYEKGLLPPQHIGTTIRQYKDDSNRIKVEVEDFPDDIRQDFIDIRKNIQSIDEKNAELKKISSLIVGIIDVAKIEKDYQENERLLVNNRDTMRRISENIGASNNAIASLEKEIAGLVQATEKNAKLNKCIAYALEIFDWFNVSYQKRELEVKEDLLASVNTIFDQMYHGKRKVTIDDKYKINLLTSVGDVDVNTDESKGLEAVKNFAFICGLVDLAKKKVRNTDDEAMLSTEPYPLVMDAPFSNADEKHISKISSIIPIIAEQVILVVMKKDWNCAKEAIGNKIGTMYEIEKHSETNSSIGRVK